MMPKIVATELKPPYLTSSEGRTADGPRPPGTRRARLRAASRLKAQPEFDTPTVVLGVIWHAPTSNAAGPSLDPTNKMAGARAGPFVSEQRWSW
jgi:hypothetical protein